VAGGGVKWFYMPACNIPAASGATNQTFNLYEQYQKQFEESLNPSLWRSSNNSLSRIPSPDDSRLYSPGELDYVITYFDEDVFTIGSTPINPSGVLTYSVKTNPPITSATYFNIIFIVK
jgi:hypothetical protein